MTKDIELFRKVRPGKDYDLKHLSKEFETLGDMQEESDTRVRTLEKSSAKLNQRLGKKLSACSQRKPCGSSACPRCFSQIRRWSYSELRYLIEKYGGNVFIMTVLFYSEMMGDKALFRYDFEKLKRRLRKQLQRSGFTSPVIGYIEFDYHAESSLWLPHFHLMVLGDETSAIKKFRGVCSKQRREIGATVDRPLHICKLKDEVKQVSYLCKSYCSRVEAYLNEDDKRRTRKCRLKPIQLRLSLHVFDRLGLTGRLFLYRARCVGNEIRV